MSGKLYRATVRGEAPHGRWREPGEVFEYDGPKAKWMEDATAVPSAVAHDDAPSLTGKNKAELLAIAAAEGVDVADGATNAQIVAAIEAKRGE